jgi:hypothetical protein
VTFGADATGVRSFLENPLGSSHPYATSDARRSIASFAAYSPPLIRIGDAAACHWAFA